MFINYRRTDSQQAAFAFYFQLRAQLGPGSVFMDRSGISAGDVWHRRLLEKIELATVILALMGPNWLKSADEYGRRRLDMPDDWVRKELAAALKPGKTVIPILLTPLTAPPVVEALPDALSGLDLSQAYSLRDDHWEDDMNGLVRLMIDRHRFTEAPQPLFPPREVTVTPLTEDQLHEKLASLPGWEPVESLIPGDYPKSRLELRKLYIFESFQLALQFMKAGIDPIDELQHHPRWENQWRTVTVYLSTWDIGHRISELDIRLAKILDGTYDKVIRPSAYLSQMRN